MKEESFGSAAKSGKEGFSDSIECGRPVSPQESFLALGRTSLRFVGEFFKPHPGKIR